jgi:hypothetical protein
MPRTPRRCDDADCTRCSSVALAPAVVVAAPLGERDVSYLVSQFNAEEAIEHLRAECGVSDDQAEEIMQSVHRTLAALFASVRRRPVDTIRVVR